MSDRQFSLADLFEVVVDTVPDRLALVAGPDRLTYRQLDERANRFAHYLVDQGVAAGAHVGILAYNRAEWVEAMIGCYKARTVPVNLNYRYVAPELRYVIDNADLEVLVFERALAPLVAESLDGADRTLRRDWSWSRTGPGSTAAGLVATSYAVRPRLLVARPRLRAPLTRRHLHPLHRGHHRHAQGRALASGGHLLRRHGRGRLGRPSPSATPTSWPVGSTPTTTARMVMLVVAPLMHGNAQWVMWNAFMMAGTAVLYTEHRYDPDALWRLIGEEGVGIGGAGRRRHGPAPGRRPGRGTPGTYDTSTLVVVGSGGAMLSKTVKDELQQRLPKVMVLDSFGSSESGAQGAVEDGASGPRFVMKDDTSVLDDDLVPLTPGDGRIGRLARTGRIPIGYYKDRPRPRPPSRWTHGVRWSIPGDLASVEPDGTIMVHGRGSASINSGGEKIFPEEVEAAVKTHPGVFDAIVVGVPDERFGERVAVAVRPRDPGAAPSLEELQDALPCPHRRLQDPPPAAGGGGHPAHRVGQARLQGGQGPLLTGPVRSDLDLVRPPPAFGRRPRRPRCPPPGRRRQPAPPRRSRRSAPPRRRARGPSPGPAPVGRATAARPPGPGRPAPPATPRPGSPRTPTPAPPVPRLPAATGPGSCRPRGTRSSERPFSRTVGVDGQAHWSSAPPNWGLGLELGPVQRRPQRRSPAHRLGQHHGPGPGGQPGHPRLPVEGAPPGLLPPVDGLGGHRSDRVERGPEPAARTGLHHGQAQRPAHEGRSPREGLLRRSQRLGSRSGQAEERQRHGHGTAAGNGATSGPSRVTSCRRKAVRASPSTEVEGGATRARVRSSTTVTAPLRGV